MCRFDRKSLGAITASLHRCITTSLHQCITASCITASKKTSNQGVGFFSSISKKWINTALCSDSSVHPAHDVSTPACALIVYATRRRKRNGGVWQEKRGIGGVGGDVWITTSLHHCISASLHQCITASLHHCISTSLHHCITASL